MRRVYAVAGCALALMSSACTGGGQDDPAPAPTAPPSRPVQRLRPGTHVEVTAVVSRVYGTHAFVVEDADLPPTGQLVVSDAPVTVLVPELVTLSGLVEQLDQAALRHYGIGDSALAVVVIASAVRDYPGESPTA
ncbi:hypothetical protein ACQP1P_20055 [Dactylosporangium sp. CA-052675]|uniref:hypothetical protein n=1 Tax=Dactylosporangium sp. CA-052675 TaxID=3239927 RepID=UPI003D89B181